MHPDLRFIANSFYFIARRYVTLLEVLISIALTVIILTTLTFFYRQVGMIGAEVGRISIENFRMRYAETRLASILPKVVAENNKNKDFVFFSINDDSGSKPGSQGLIFTFFNGISLDKEIANHALGRIYLDNDNNLVFAYWPSPKRWEKDKFPEMKKEILLENVDDVKFEFFIPPDKNSEGENSQKDSEKDLKNQNLEKKDLEKSGSVKDSEKKDSEKDSVEKPTPEPKNAWRTDLWLKEYDTLPAMIRVNLTIKDKPVTFAFPLTHSKDHVIYGN